MITIPQNPVPAVKGPILFVFGDILGLDSAECKERKLTSDWFYKFGYLCRVLWYIRATYNFGDLRRTLI